MLEPNGRLTCDYDRPIVTPDPLYGGEHVAFPIIWVGGPVANVNERLIRDARYALGRELRVGDVATIGQYRIRLVAVEMFDWQWIAIRDGARARVYERIYPLSRLLRVIKTRIIWTAAVWGCAAVEPHTIPRWRDLRWPFKRKARR